MIAVDWYRVARRVHHDTGILCQFTLSRGLRAQVRGQWLTVPEGIGGGAEDEDAAVTEVACWLESVEAYRRDVLVHLRMYRAMGIEGVA